MNETNSNVLRFRQLITDLGYTDTIRATHFLMETMNAKNGFTRQGNGEDYFVHPIRCGLYALNHGIRKQITITGIILHDVLEDVPWYTEQMMLRDYGYEVTHMVKLLTKNPNIDYKVNKEALDEYLENIAQDTDAAICKACDRIDNFSTLEGCTPEKKLRYANETEQHFLKFFKYCRKNYPEYASFFESAKHYITPHLREIKEHYDDVQRLEKIIAELKAGNLQKAN